MNKRKLPAIGRRQFVGTALACTILTLAQDSHPENKTKSCCIPVNPKGGTRQESFDPNTSSQILRKVLKSGSFVCAPN